MAVFKLTLEAYAGSAIEHCCVMAQRVADTLGVNVGFNFNDVECLAMPGGTDAELISQWGVQIRRKNADLAPHERRFARSIPRRAPTPSETTP